MRVIHGVMAASLFSIAACGGGEAGTEANTEVFDWSRTTLTSMEDVVLGDDVGEGTTGTKTLVFQPASRGNCEGSYAEVRVQLDFAHGEVDLHMDEETHLVPRSVKATVLQNDVWLVDGECEHEVRVPLGDATGGQIEIPRAFFAACQLTFQKGDDTRIASFEISGDGTIEVSAGFDDVRIE